MLKIFKCTSFHLFIFHTFHLVLNYINNYNGNINDRRGSRILKWGVNFCNNVIFYRAKAWLRCLRSVQRRALKELINVNNKEVILKKADKGRTTVVMNGENKINDGQKQLDDRNNCQPLDQPMVRDTSQRVKHLINALHQAGCIDEVTVKWFNLTPNPPRSPVFYTLTKIHKPTLVGSQDLSYLGVMAQQNAYHHSKTNYFSQ